MTYKHTKIACYIGFTVQAIINNFLPILFIIFQTEYNLSYEKLGRIIFINFFTQIFSDLLTPYISKLLGYRNTVILCHGLSAAGLVMLTVLPLVLTNFYLALSLSVIVYAFGSGIIEVILTPLVDLLPSKNRAASMAFTHSFYSWGQILTVAVTTALVFFFGYSNWRYIPIIWAAIPLFNIFLFLKVPVIEPKEGTKEKSKSELFKTREFWCFAVFMICAGVSEITMSEWASVFVQNSFGVGKVIGDLLGPCSFALFMGIGRIIFGNLSGRFSVRNILIINNIFTFACYFIVGVSGNVWISLLCCALCGFSVSISWPGTYSLAANRFPTGGTLMFSIYALCGDMGCSAGPWLLGYVADRVNLKSGFAVCAVFPLIMIAAALVLPKKSCKNNGFNV